jgi:hypothetical protein
MLAPADARRPLRSSRLRHGGGRRRALTREETHDREPRQEAGIALPDGIASLGPEAAEHVRRLIRDAERRQDEEIDEALETTLRVVPRPLRGTVRKVLAP